MTYKGVLEDIRTCVNLGIPKRVPVFAISELCDIRICGLIHSEYTQSIDKMAKCRIESVKRFDYDWSCGWPDDYVEFEPLGVKTKGEEDIPLGPYEFLSPTEETLKKLKIPDFQNDGRTPMFLEVLKRIKKELGDSICLTGRVAAPFTGVSLLYGIEEALTLFLENPKLFRETMDFLTEMTIKWAQAQIQAGVDAIWVGDCVASSGFISPKLYREFALQSALKVNETLKEKAFVFYHAGESSLQHLELMAESQPSALSIGGKLDISIAKKSLNKKVCIMGNIRGIEVLQRGTSEDVERETIRIMGTGKKNGGYIFNSEEGIPRETSEENMRIMMQTAKKHNEYI